MYFKITYTILQYELNNQRINNFKKCIHISVCEIQQQKYFVIRFLLFKAISFCQYVKLLFFDFVVYDQQNVSLFETRRNCNTWHDRRECSLWKWQQVYHVMTTIVYYASKAIACQGDRLKRFTIIKCIKFSGIVNFNNWWILI